MARPELSIERCLAELRWPHGEAVKLDPAGRVGIPDRLLILPHRIVFVEVKRPGGGVVSAAQHEWRRRLMAWGHEHMFIDSKEAAHALLEPYARSRDREGRQR